METQENYKGYSILGNKGEIKFAKRVLDILIMDEALGINDTINPKTMKKLEKLRQGICMNADWIIIGAVYSAIINEIEEFHVHNKFGHQFLSFAKLYFNKRSR